MKYLEGFLSYDVVFMDSSEKNWKSAIGTYSETLSPRFAIRLLDYTPIYVAEFMAIY